MNVPPTLFVTSFAQSLAFQHPIRVSRPLRVFHCGLSHQLAYSRDPIVHDERAALALYDHSESIEHP
jgi:hypothetical protein